MRVKAPLLWLTAACMAWTSNLTWGVDQPRPASVFAGCDSDKRAPAANANPRDRVSREPKVDRFSQRAFASFSMDEVESGAAGDTSALCWARLDGVWRQNAQIVLDSSQINSDIWGSDSPELISLATGVYTTPRHIVIVEPDDPAGALYLATGLTGNPFVKFVSNDGLDLKQVITRGGPAKTYAATATFGYGHTLRLSVTRSGRVRLQLDGTDYYRPEPNNSTEAMANQISAEDPFLMPANLEYLPASRRGYDIAYQDPFYLNSNSKLEVFTEASPQHYYIEEKRVIPVSFKYIPESSQGTVYRKSLVSSERHMQETASHSFGGSVSAGATSVALSTTKSSMNSLRESESVAQAIGYSRTKKYALVLDHPYVTLSDAFVDAVEDARRDFKYQALIDRFGTHYPYAVTYGATAKMTQSFTESSYTRIASQNSGFSASAGATAFGIGGTVDVSQQSGTSTGTSGSLGSENASFVAVGGNGSWDQNGYSAGESHYPVLLDLRPIWELLNPMNFPGEPEVYQTVRLNLMKAVALHLRSVAQREGPIDTASLLPQVKPAEPEPVEVWHVYLRHAWCTGKGVGKVKRAEGKLTITQGEQKTTRKQFDVECKKKYDTATYSYQSSSPELLRVTGTRSEIKAMSTEFMLDWIYQGTVFKQTWKTSNVSPFGTRSHPFFTNLGVGSRKDYKWSVNNNSKWPTLYLRLRFKRVR